MPISHNRRSFITVLASLSGFVATLGESTSAAHTQAAVGTEKWDFSWLEQLAGKHKQVYDYGSFDLTMDVRPLRYVKNYLDTYRDVFGLRFPEMNTVVGISRALPVNVADAIWLKYRLGERWKITDPETKQPAVRNIFMGNGIDDEGVKALQARGTLFWQCNVALGNIAQQLAQATQQPAQAVRADLVAGLNSGVRLVPSHVMAVGMVQERGFTYFKP